MQVASVGVYGAVYQPNKRDEGSLASKMLREQAEQSAQIAVTSASINILQVVQQYEVSVKEVKQVSKYALLALDYIANSTRLSPEDRRTLIRLVAIVDEFAGGDPKLMRDIIGIAKIMEMNATQNYKPIPLREALRMYFEERERLDPSKEMTISVESEINAVSVRVFGTSITETFAAQEEALSKPSVYVNA
ncbi:MAG: hypothetical protein ACK502_10480 [Alphaproteobacteria bacterium]